MMKSILRGRFEKEHAFDQDLSGPSELLEVHPAVGERWRYDFK